MGNEIPTVYSLAQNFPNPFNPSTTLKYGLPARSTVRLIIYNLLGQVVKEMVNTEQQAGYQSVVWNATVSSGLYFYRIEATAKDDPSKRFVQTRKMILLR
jgi:flagellar hook assembly protein FlgD